MENNFKTLTEEEWNTHIEEKAQFAKEYYTYQMKKGKSELMILKDLIELELRPAFIQKNNLVNCLETNLCIRVQIHHTLFFDGLVQERLKKSKSSLRKYPSQEQGYLKDMFHE